MKYCYLIIVVGIILASCSKKGESVEFEHIISTECVEGYSFGPNSGWKYRNMNTGVYDSITVLSAHYQLQKFISSVTGYQGDLEDGADYKTTYVDVYYLQIDQTSVSGTLRLDAIYGNTYRTFYGGSIEMCNAEQIDSLEVNNHMYYNVEKMSTSATTFYFKEGIGLLRKVDKSSLPNVYTDLMSYNVNLFPIIEHSPSLFFND
jgi:hypothetical protein